MIKRYEIAFQTIDAPDYEREGKSCALVSDKQLFIKAVFTQDSIEDYCRFEYLNFSVALRPSAKIGALHIIFVVCKPSSWRWHGTCKIP